VLNARRGWQPAMAFYRRLGFRVTRIFTQAMWHREGRG
jgi:ribosomal protein S18 acetylase RimI-like enzyme